MALSKKNRQFRCNKFADFLLDITGVTGNILTLLEKSYTGVYSLHTDFKL